MTQAQAENLGYRIERYPCLPAMGLGGRRYLWRLLAPDGRTINAGYQSRRALLAWLEEEKSEWQQYLKCEQCGRRLAKSDFRICTACEWKPEQQR